VALNGLETYFLGLERIQLLWAFPELVSRLLGVRHSWLKAISPFKRSLLVLLGVCSVVVK
jgi:hypothetical protein